MTRSLSVSQSVSKRELWLIVFFSFQSFDLLATLSIRVRTRCRNKVWFFCFKTLSSLASSSSSAGSYQGKTKWDQEKNSFTAAGFPTRSKHPNIAGVCQNRQTAAWHGTEPPIKKTNFRNLKRCTQCRAQSQCSPPAPRRERENGEVTFLIDKSGSTTFN